MMFGDEPKSRSWRSLLGCAWKAHTGLPGVSGSGGYVTGGRPGHEPSTDTPEQLASSAMIVSERPLDALVTQSPVSTETSSFAASMARGDQTPPPVEDDERVSK